MIASPDRARSEECSAPFATDRPTGTNGHGTVGAGCIQLEMPFVVNRAPQDTGLSFAPLVRIGVGANFELRLADELMGIDIPDHAAVSAGDRPLSLETKIMGVAQKDTIPGFGVLAGATVPIGKSAGQGTSAYVSTLTDGNIAAGFGYSVNLIATAQPVADTTGHRLQLSYAAVLSYSPPLKDSWLMIHIDGTGGALVLAHAPWQQSLGGGFCANTSSDVQLFAAAYATVTGKQHPYSLGPGVVVRLR